MVDMNLAKSGSASLCGPRGQLELVHAFGVYPAALRDAVISLGDDAFAFIVGRHIALCDHVHHHLNFIQRDARNRAITAATRSASGRLLAIAERLGAEDGSVQISILNLPSSVGNGQARNGQGDEEVLRILHPSNRRLDIVGLSFTADGKFIVSLSAMPDSTVTYWRWEIEKAVSSHDIQLPVTRLHVNPQNGNNFSVSGPKYLRLWEYNPNDHHLRENPSMFPLKQEKHMNVVDHCWVLQLFLCAATEDGHVHLFEDGEHRQDVDVRAVIAQEEARGQKAMERDQARLIQNLMGGGPPGANQEAPPVQLLSLAAWGRGFVVGGDQGFLGVFKVDARLQVEAIGTFRMPGDEGCLWQMSASAEDTYLTILSYTVPEQEGAERASTAKALVRASHARANAAGVKPEVKEKERLWSLTTFPVGQADLAATGQLELFTPVFARGTHNGPISSLGAARHRRIVASCGNDMQLKVWGFPSQDAHDPAGTFTSELGISVSTYERPRALAVHPLGFQVAVVLDDMLRVYHLTTQQTARTLFDLSLKHPGDVAYSNSGHMLAVTSDHDVILLDPWSLVVIHIFSGRGGHLSAVTQVLFSEDDRVLLSCSAAPHGAIYGWDLDTEAKERAFEHVSKGTSYLGMAHDFQRQLVVSCTKPEGHLRVVGHLNSTFLELPAERNAGFTALCLVAPLGALFVGTQAGCVRVFSWPLAEGGVGANPHTEVALHAHPVTALTLSGDAGLLFSACAGGAIMACEVSSGTGLTTAQLNQRLARFRHRVDVGPRKTNRDDERKVLELQQKLSETKLGTSTNTASLDELVMVPRAYFNDCLGEIKELEDRMQSLRHESEYVLEQKEQEMQDKMHAVQSERQRERKSGDEKYDSLFSQLKRANERHERELSRMSGQFDQRNRELQEQFDSSISKEYEKQSRLLDELQGLRDQYAAEKKQVELRHHEQLEDLRETQERAIREWRAEYDKVCNLLKSDGLKFEEAFRQQEGEYEGQISEILEHKRVALHIESEKSTTALKDGVSMKQTINMLQRQIKVKDDHLAELAKDRDDLRLRLEAAQEMFNKVKDQLKERERGLKVKDESLAKMREQMKHLESFRFVLFHKVRAMEEERDPLEEQVNSLKTSVREMYNEFVREFRQKQKLDQQLSEKSTLSSSLQQENVELRARLAQLKKDGKRLLQDVEQVLHAESTTEFERMPKRLQLVLEKYKKMSEWAPPAAGIEAGAGVAKDESKEASMIEELVTQRDLLYRKNQISVAAASQAKRECAHDFRRLTSENAQLIAEMNTLRNENKSYQRRSTELEASVIAFRVKDASKGKADSMVRVESAPALQVMKPVPQANGRQGHHGATAETPYVRRKIVDQQELYRRQRQKQLNQLPPVAHPPTLSAHERSSSPTGGKQGRQSSQEMRFSQSLDSANAGRRNMERQGFNLGKLRDAAEAATEGHWMRDLPLEGASLLAAGQQSDEGSFPPDSGIQG